MSPTGNAFHDLLIAVLLEFLAQYERRTGNRRCVSFPPHSFYMPPGVRDYQPDVGVIADRRKDRPIEKSTEGAPDIAVEVLSPSTERRDRGLKALRYFEEGTREYWLFDPEGRTAEFLRRSRSGWTPVLAAQARCRTPLLPGFALDLGAVWRRFDQKLRRPRRPKRRA